MDWRGLLRGIAEELSLDIEVESDLLSIAQYHINASNQSRDRLNQILVEEFTRNATPTLAHQILARLPIKTYWTTNYDPLIEKALEAQGRKADVKTTTSRLTTTRPRSTAAVYKMHGDAVDPERMVITRDDYEQYARDHALFLSALQSDLLRKTFLFLGLSLTDPNLDFVLGQVRAAVGNSPRTHYTIMRREQRSDHKADRPFEYALNKQRLHIYDLQRYGIRTVLIDDYSEIPEMLAELERRYYRRHVVVSGAATSFHPLGRERLEALCWMLGERIVEEDYNLVSGIGLGIGNHVLAGALEALYREEEPALDQRLRLRPFPQVVSAGVNKDQLYNRYRADLLSGTGFIVFISGNKVSDDGTVVASDGVMKEFSIARELNMYPIPIGASGWAAEQIWHQVNESFDKIYPKGTPLDRFEKLADTGASNEELLDAAFELIRRLTPRAASARRVVRRS